MGVNQKSVNRENGKVHEHEQSPVEAAYVIQNLSSAYQTVCDPFCGVGTTGVSALKLNRRFIGVELDENYFVTATDRLHKVMRGIK